QGLNMGVCGVYRIINEVTRKSYFGSSLHVQERLATHRRRLRRAIHHSVLLQRAWEKHGEAAFVFEIVLKCLPEDRLFYEQLCLDGYRSYEPMAGYNICPKASCTSGRPHTAEARFKISAYQRGRRKSPEHAEKIRLANTGKKRSPEQNERMRARLKGRK